MTTTSQPVPPPPAPDAETRVSGDHHESLRLWLRLMTCTLMIERDVRARLRERFAITLPRFDLLAQLERYPQGLRMGELSRRLMVTGGNVTGLTNELVAEGLVLRRPLAGDRRAHAVRLTAKGRRAFDAMAAEHERWIVRMFSGVPAADRARLYALLGSVKSQLRSPENVERITHGDHR
ncbi:MAG: MarR family transcriptional regulator [Burkholderiales bacterium]|nr:MarR family transcriptional regulator [Burkholderiales bacterium]